MSFSANATDSYEYDAFGNALVTTGTTPNVYLYRGEQFDSDLGLYYLRARYYNPATGRFMSRDPEEGRVRDPRTLHKYLYAGGDPVNMIDPTGRAELFETALIEGGSLRAGMLPALVELAGGTVATVTAWAIAVETAAEEITGYLAEVAAEETAGQTAAAWNSLLAAINEYGALLTEESIWGGINRLLLCTDVGLISAQIAEHTGILSPNGAHIEEVTSIFGCGVGLEFVVRR